MISLNLQEPKAVKPPLMIVSTSNGSAETPREHQHATDDPSNGDMAEGASWLSKVPRLERLQTEHRTSLVFESGSNSRASEQFRIMQHRLTTAGPKGGVVLVTSPGAADGKSLNCQNLAYALAEAGHKTLLLDLDLRRPALMTAFGGVSTQGIEQVLRGEITPETAVRSVGNVPLYFIGLEKPVTAPMLLLRSAELSTLLKWGQDNFEWIVLDSPPVLPVADVEQLLPSADFVLMVVRERVTTRAMVQRAAEMLGEHLSSVIFNDVSMSITAGYGSNYDQGYR